jgi:protocatechuate 4,5-dioxygenase beta chain
MIVLGIGTSHAPGVLLPVDRWAESYALMTRGVGQPATAQAETPEANVALRARINDAVGRLRTKLAEARPDLVVIIGDDQDEVFGRPFNPTLAVFCGDSVAGETLPRFADEPGLNRTLELRCPSDFGQVLAAGLVARGFDPAVLQELRPVGRSSGIGHAFTRPAEFLGLADADIPVLPVFLNCYHRPLPAAERCYELGEAIAEIAAERPERIAIVASGGLSHDPGGPRAGWIDRSLDEWVLRAIETGHGSELARLFSFDSETLAGGTGEIRAWVALAGVFGARKAEVVDYIPVHHAVTGLGFAYWPGDEEE